MRLFNKLKYRNIGYVVDADKQREYEMLQKVGSLHHVVAFVEELRLYDYLYFINPNDLWNCFDFCYNKMANSVPQINKKEFNKNLLRIVKAGKSESLKRLITEGCDAYEVAKIIVRSEKEAPKSSVTLSKCGNLDLFLMRKSIEILCSKMKELNTTDTLTAYDKLIRMSFVDKEIKKEDFKFYASMFMNICHKTVPDTDETILTEALNGNTDLVINTMNEISHYALSYILFNYSNKFDEKNIYFDKYHELVRELNKRNWEFSKKTTLSNKNNETNNFLYRLW